MFLTNWLSLGYVLSAVIYKVNSNDLVAVVQIFRHGERTPMTFYTNDPFKDHWKNLELEQLTNRGRLQLYSLGQFTKRRYTNWLPTKYDRSTFNAQTTDVDRTHISGQSFLYGLFPAYGDQKWIENIDWQAIPLHPADPRILWVSSANCPAYQTLYDEVLASEDFVNVNKNYSNLYTYLSEKTGDNITDLHCAEIIWDTLKIEAGVNLTLPEWTKTVYPEPLTTLSGIWIKSLSYTTKLKQFYTGPLLNELLDYFDSMTVNSSSPKFKLYSGHDDNIAAILNSLGAFDQPYMLQFGSSLWIELRNDINKYYINIWLKNGDEEDEVQIQIKGCALDCPLEQLRKLLKPILVDVKTWTDECNVDNHNKK